MGFHALQVSSAIQPPARFFFAYFPCSDNVGGGRGRDEEVGRGEVGVDPVHRADYRNMVEEPWAGTGGLSEHGETPQTPSAARIIGTWVFLFYV